MSIRSRIKSLVAKEQPQSGTMGASGNSVFAGMLYEDEYNSDLHGDRGLKIYDKMRRSDGQVKAGLLACKLPLIVARWDIQPASESGLDIDIAAKVKADLFEKMTITWNDFLRQALLMLDFGHMAYEKVWEYRDNRWTWKKLAPRLPLSIREWHLTEDDELDFIRQWAIKGDKFIMPDIPAAKLLIFTHEQEGANFRGISLLRAAYKHWYYKNNLYAIDGIAAERHGIGLATFKYPDQANASQKAAIHEMGQRLHAHERGYIATPASIEFDLKGVQGQLHDIKGSIDHHDLQIVRSILAQFMNLGAKSTGSYALSQDQSQFFLMALQAVAKNVCDTVNRYCIQQMVDYNWFVTGYPKLIVSGLDSPDVLAYAQSITGLVSAGAIVMDDESENELRRMVKLPPKSPNAGPRPEPKPLEQQISPSKVSEWPANAGEQVMSLIKSGSDITKVLNAYEKAQAHLKAADFWRAPVSMEKFVAFSEIAPQLDTFEEKFIKAVKPLQDKQIKVLVRTAEGYLEDKQYERMAEIDVPYRKEVADAIDDLLSEMIDYGAEQVNEEAKKQGAIMKAAEITPPDPMAFIRIRALAIANILANRLRAALSWEALRQLRQGTVTGGQLTASLTDLSDKELGKMSKQSVSEAFNLGRQKQAEDYSVKEITSSALMDSNTCDYCASMDGKKWKPGEAPVDEPPYEDCEGKDHCRCIWVYTFNQEV